MFFDIFGVPDHNVLERCKNDANAAGTARSKPGGRICRARNRMTDSFLSQDIYQAALLTESPGKKWQNALTMKQPCDSQRLYW